ncbi:hypothetical protein ACFE04_001752 [Oxalis oulophora]
MKTQTANNYTHHLLFLFFFLFQVAVTSVVTAIGVNYGTVANNLPPPAQVANWLKTQTTIESVKIFDMNQDIIRAFANTGISLTVTVPNGDIPMLTNVRNARRWVSSNIASVYPGTKIKYILMGSEVLHWGTKEQIDSLVPAMRSLQAALVKDGFNTIKVTTAHSLGMLEISVPPSKGQFWSFYAQPVLSPMLKFLREAKSPFMFNPYPYFGYYQNNSDYVLFRPNKGVYDKYTKITYHNMFEALIDATYSAMKSLGYGDVDIVLGETGWPSVGDPGMNWCTVDNARQYNGNVRKVVDSGAGTPLLPKRKFETYIFSLFNENLKPGSEAERNFGLFRPDFSSVYDIGITRSGSQPVPTPAASGGKKWCVTKQEAISDAALTSNINYACNQGVDCSVIRSGGACYNPNNLKSHASYVMNAYYQTHGRNNFNCDFAGTGRIVTSDPSKCILSLYFYSVMAHASTDPENEDQMKI